MKSTKFLMMSLAALSMLACNKEKNDGIDDKTPKTVTVQFDTGNVLGNGDDPATGKSTVSDAVVFFASSDNVVVNAFEVDAASTPGLSDLIGAGATFTGIKGQAKKVYIVANNKKNSGPAIKDLKTIALVKDAAAGSVSLQNTGSDAWKNATMANNTAEAPITGTAPTFVASPTIAPLVGRMEVSNIDKDASIAAFKLKGMYINGHFKNLKLGGVAVGNAYNGGSVADNYIPANFPGLCIEDLGDNGNLRIGGSGKCAGFQLVAGTPATGTNISIILRCGNIRITGEASDLIGERFVTIKLKDGANPVTSILANTVYKVGAITIKAENFTENPETEDQAVKVSVTVAPWTVKNITPEL